MVSEGLSSYPAPMNFGSSVLVLVAVGVFIQVLIGAGILYITWDSWKVRKEILRRSNFPTQGPPTTSSPNE